jgi:hypothetical protein
MKNAGFWNIKTQFVPYRRHITSPLQSLRNNVRIKYQDLISLTETFCFIPAKNDEIEPAECIQDWLTVGTYQRAPLG